MKSLNFRIMKTSQLYFFISLLTLLFISCTSGKKNDPTSESKELEATAVQHQWTDKHKLEFERNCVGFLEREGVVNAKEYCDCLLEASVTNYPDPEVASELEQNDIVKMFEESKCLDDILLIKIEDPWTEEVEKLFVKHCQEAQAEQGVGEDAAQAYCDCALVEIKEIVPNPHHVMSLTQEELDHILNKCKPE